MPRHYDFEVSLCDVEPRIHRRFLLRDAGAFATLHNAIQDACGWENYHMFAFRTAPAYHQSVGFAAR